MVSTVGLLDSLRYFIASLSFGFFHLSAFADISTHIADFLIPVQMFSSMQLIFLSRPHIDLSICLYTL